MPAADDLEARLQRALTQDRLTFHYQPIVDLSSGATTDVEALARWYDDDLGQVSPDTFIQVAEATGLIVELGRTALLHACRTAAAWPDGELGPIGVSVNVSPVQLRDPDLVDDVADALVTSALLPSRLSLEITETAIVADVDAAAATLRELRRLGVRIALDDFGTGHSSLTLLRNLPLDTVKIDRSLIARVAEEAHGAVLVRLVLDAAHTLGLGVCAEGIEEVPQAHQLVVLGCDTGQGWLFGRPAPLEGPPTSLAFPRPTPGWLDLGAPPVLLGASDDLVVMADDGGLITYVSAAYHGILGGHRSDLVGKPLDELLGGTPEPGPVTLRARHADGTSRWLRGTVQPLRADSGVPQETLVVLSDVTTLVERERALADSELLFRSAFDGAPTGITLSDFEGRLLRVNTAFATMLGHDVDELVGRTIAETTHPDDLAADADNLREVRMGTVTVHHVVKRCLHKDGHAVEVEVYAATAHTADGEPSCIVAHVLPR